MSGRRGDLILSLVAGKRASVSGWVRANCPFCETRTGKADKNASLGVKRSTGRWHCFRCGAAGWIPVDDDGDVGHIGEAESEDPEAGAEPIELPAGFVALYDEPGWSADSLEWAREYVRARGISDEVAGEMGIGFTPNSEDWWMKKRVVIPVRGADDQELLGWSARSISKNQRTKYLYPPGMNRAKLLFNQAALLVETDRPLFVGEGVFDAAPFWPDGVGCLGKPTEEQIEILSTARRPVVSLLDGDAWTESEALALRLIVSGVRAGWIRFPPRTDPNTVDRQAIEEIALRAFETWPVGETDLSVLATVARLGGASAVDEVLDVGVQIGTLPNKR
jgi:DNA primase